MPNGRFVARSPCTAPRSRIVDHGVILKVTPNGPEIDVDAMRRRGMHVPAADAAAHDAGAASRSLYKAPIGISQGIHVGVGVGRGTVGSRTLGDIQRQNDKFYSRGRSGRDAAGEEGELRCTFPRARSAASRATTIFCTSIGPDGDTLATFFGHHEAREQDDGSTTVHFLGEKPGAMEHRQPEPAQDSTVIVGGSPRDNPQGVHRALAALADRNRKFYGA